MALPSSRSLRIVFAASLAVATTLFLVAACTDQANPTRSEADGEGLPKLTDEGGGDAFVPDSSDQDARTDGGMDAPITTDASKDAPADVISGDAKVGDICSFNRECQANLRCECTEVDGCACKVGVRGTGQNGVTECDSGNQCASSVCVEGQANKFYCTDECEGGADCKPNLPQCKSIAFVGRICVR